MSKRILNRNTLSTFVGAILASVSFIGTATASDLAGKWQQTTSNAGDCPTCSLLIQNVPDDSRLLFVTANNGWNAQVTRNTNDPNTATGYGQWSPSVGGTYAGKMFRISLNTLNNSVAMTMSMLDPELPAPVKATYSLADLQNRSAAIYPYEAGSWGGIVRGGPGMNFRKQDSLREKEGITIIERTDRMMNGYPWMKIRYRNGKTGYKWGGILCSTDFPRNDIYKKCEGDGETTTYRCDNGQTLSVQLDSRAAETLAVIKSGGETVYLVQVISGSGSRYSNGDQEFHSKANEAIFTDRGKTVQCRTR